MYSVAHGFLNGLVKGFWSLVARPAKKVLAFGDDIRLTDDQHAIIRRRVQELRGTTCFTSSLPDLLQCVFAFVLHLCFCIAYSSKDHVGIALMPLSFVCMVLLMVVDTLACVDVQWHQLDHGGQASVGGHGDKLCPLRHRD